MKTHNTNQTRIEGTYCIVSAELSSLAPGLNAERTALAIHMAHTLGASVEVVRGMWEGHAETSLRLTGMEALEAAEHIADAFQQAAFISVANREAVVYDTQGNRLQTFTKMVEVDGLAKFYTQLASGLRFQFQE